MSERKKVDAREVAAGDMPPRLRHPSEYKAWTNMRARQRNGTANVDACFNDFETFFEELGPKPEPSFSLERKDNKLGYISGNICWADKTAQANNRRNTKYLTYDGERLEYVGKTLPLTEWARKTEQHPSTLRRRLTDGWTETEAIDGQRKRAPRPFHMMSEKELLNFQPWPRHAAKSDEQAYLDNRRHGEDRFDFELRVNIAVERRELLREAEEIGAVRIRRASADRKQDLFDQGAEILDNWALVKDADLEAFDEFLPKWKLFLRYVRKVKEGRDAWRHALKLRLTPQRQKKAALEVGGKYRAKHVGTFVTSEHTENSDD